MIVGNGVPYEDTRWQKQWIATAETVNYPLSTFN